MKSIYKIILLAISITFSTSLLLNASEKESYENKEIIGISVSDTTINENIVIRLELDDEWEYMIFTSEGNCIRMGMLEKGKNKISLKDMCKGEYFVYLNNGHDRYMRKVIQ